MTFVKYLLGCALFASAISANAQNTFPGHLDTQNLSTICAADVPANAENIIWHHRGLIEEGNDAPATFKSIADVMYTHMRIQGLNRQHFAKYAYGGSPDAYVNESLMRQPDGSLPEFYASNLRQGDLIVTIRDVPTTETKANLIKGMIEVLLVMTPIGRGKIKIHPVTGKNVADPLVQNIETVREAYKMHKQKTRAEGLDDPKYYQVITVTMVNEVYNTAGGVAQANISTVEFNPDSLTNLAKRQESGELIGESWPVDMFPRFTFTENVVIDDSTYPLNRIDSQARKSSVVVRLPQMAEVDYIRNRSGTCNECGGLEQGTAEWQQCMRDHDYDNMLQLKQGSFDLFEKVYGDYYKNTKCFADRSVRTCDDRRACLEKYDVDYFKPTGLSHKSDPQLCQDLNNTCHEYTWSADLMQNTGTTYFQEKSYRGADSIMYSTNIISDTVNLHSLSGVMCANMIREMMNKDLLAGLDTELHSGGIVEFCGQRREVQQCMAGVIAGLSDIELEAGVTFDSQNSEGGTGGSTGDSSMKFTNIGRSMIGRAPGFTVVTFTGGVNEHSLNLSGITNGIRNAWDSVSGVLGKIGSFIGGLFGGGKGPSDCPTWGCNDGPDDSDGVT